MSTNSKSKNLTKLIVRLLIDNYVLRDDWLELVRMIHTQEMETNNISKQDYYDSVFFTNKLSNTYTIKRMWGMVQEKRADLRGNDWEERQRQGGMMAKKMILFDKTQLKLFDE